MNDVNEFLRGLSASLAALKMYPVTHPQAKDVLDKAFANLQGFLQDRSELIVGIVEDEIVLEQEVLFDLSNMLKVFIKEAKARNIEKIYISHGVQFEEFTQFVSCLSAKKDTTKGSFQDQLQARGVTNIRVGSLTTTDKKDENPKLIQQQTYEHLLTQLSSLLKQLVGDAPADDNVYMELKFAVFNILENFLGKHQGLVHWEIEQKFDRVVVHSFNVSLLSMYFALRLGFVHDHVLETGVAAMVHDIGRIFLNHHRQALNAQSKEGVVLPAHTMLGAEFILRYVDKFGPLPVIVTLEHHMPYKFTSAKEEQYPQTPHLVSRIVKMCDVYDTILQRRSGTRDYSPQAIYRFMMRGQSRLFHPQLLEKFFKIVGIWPRGTIVVLTDDRIAIVREENEDNPAAPKVEIVGAPKGQNLLDLRQVRDTVTISRHLNPFAEGKEYLSLI